MKQDRFLTAILGAIGLLVVLAVVLFFVRGTPEYLPENGPADIVNNYIIALEKGEYQRAYDYLAAGEGKPEFASFRQYFSGGRSTSDNAGVQILNTETVAGEAFVNVEVIHVGNGLFDTGWREEGVAELVQQNEAWKIRLMPYAYWGYDWYMENGEVIKPRPLDN